MLNHILSASQFSRQQVDRLFQKAQQMSELELNHRLPIWKSNVMATLFYEPSTRTRLSFEAAFARFGGHVISTENAAQFSSAIKGETLEDTIKVVSSYCDVIVLRHSEAGAAERAAKVATVPVINAGDGNGEHPTQALLDMYTVHRELNTMDGLHYVFVGDLRNGRTVHSMVYMLGLCRDVRVTLANNTGYGIPAHITEFMDQRRISWRQTSSLAGVFDDKPDVVYMTRPQRERMTADQTDNQHMVLTSGMVAKMKERSVILHPLPRTAELPVELDVDHRAAYFRQAANGLWVRAALLETVL